MQRLPRGTPILRGQLHSKPSNGHVAFIPQIRKLVFEFCEAWPTSAPVREVLSLHAETLARENPHVEIVLKKRMYREPIVRGFYCEFFFCFSLVPSSCCERVQGKRTEYLHDFLSCSK